MLRSSADEVVSWSNHSTATSHLQQAPYCNQPPSASTLPQPATFSKHPTATSHLQQAECLSALIRGIEMFQWRVTRTIYHHTENSRHATSRCLWPPSSLYLNVYQKLITITVVMYFCVYSVVAELIRASGGVGPLSARPLAPTGISVGLAHIYYSWHRPARPAAFYSLPPCVLSPFVSPKNT